MGWNIFNKSSVPDELPALGMDEITSSKKEALSSQVPSFNPLPKEPSIASPPEHKKSGNENPIPKLHPDQKSNHEVIQELRNKIAAKEQEVDPIEKEKIQAPSLPGVSHKDEQGFFKELIKGVTEDPDDSSSGLNKVLKQDMVSQMKNYWEKQSPKFLLDNMSSELKDKLLAKTEKLHSLEQEWQSAYFKLLEKEEAIRSEEADLKDSLSDFMGVFQKSLKGSGKSKSSGN